MSPQLPVVKSRQLIQVLRKAGFSKQRQRGSHVILVHEDGRRATVPDHNKDMRPGTVKAILRGIGWTVDDLINRL